MKRQLRLKGVVRLILALGLLAAGLVAAAPFAHALPFDLTSDHCTGGCGTAPFGTVTLTQNGTTVDVTVHLNSPNFFVKTSSVDDQAFKFNATGVVLGDITVNQTVAGQTLAADTGAFNGDGTGDFSFGIICSTCGGGASDKFNNDIVFHVASAVIADLTAANASGNIFVADILSCNATPGGGSCAGLNGTGNTGPVDASGGTATPSGTPRVPEPSSLILLGVGLVAWRFALRKPSKNNG